MKKLQSINFEIEVIEWLKIEAKKQGRSISWMVNNYVKEKIK